MIAGAPLRTSSKERNSGPSSSQPASRPERGVLGWTPEKSGARKGFASRLETTDCGTTRRSLVGTTASGSVGTSSSTCSTPAAVSICRRNDFADSEITASSASRENRVLSRAAVCARILAIPSRRSS
jgi:hypothetical protein